LFVFPEIKEHVEVLPIPLEKLIKVGCLEELFEATLFFGFRHPEQLNNDGTITLDLPVEGFMALEINAVLSCHECCGNGSPTIFNCSPNILGKPLFTGNLQPTALKNVSGNKLSIPLSFKLCMCECR
jgi:hypothetical protein